MQWIFRLSHLCRFLDSKPPAPSARTEPAASVPYSRCVLHVDRQRLSSQVTVVHVAGELDLSTVPRLAEVLGPCLSGDVDVIVLDLSEVSFLGAAALGLFEHAHQHTQHHGRTLRLVTGSRHVDRVLGIAESIGSGPFDACPTLEAAISGHPAMVDGCRHHGFPDEVVRDSRAPAHSTASRCSGTTCPVSRRVSTTDD